MPKKILIADDSKTIREILKKWLKEKEYEVDEAQNGNEAIQKAISNKYDIILLDLVMPEADGFQVIKILKQKKVHSLIYVLSGKLHIETIKKLLQLGANVIISKPVKKECLFDEIEERSKKIVVIHDQETFLDKSQKITMSLKDIFREFSKFFNYGKNVINKGIEIDKRKFLQSLDRYFETGNKLADKGVSMANLIEKNLDYMIELISTSSLMDDKFKDAKNGLMGAAELSEEATIQIDEIAEKLQDSIKMVKQQLTEFVQSSDIDEQLRNSFNELINQLEETENIAFNIFTTLQFQDILSQKLSAVASIQNRIKIELANTINQLTGMDLGVNEKGGFITTDDSILGPQIDQSEIDKLIDNKTTDN